MVDSGHFGSGGVSLRADVDAMCVAMFNAVAGGREPDIEVCDVVGRHGLDRLVAVLTGRARVSLETAAAYRGCAQDELLDVYLDELFRVRQGDPMRGVVAGQVRTGRHRALVDADEHEAFVWALVSLDVRAVIDMVAAGHAPRLGMSGSAGGVGAVRVHRPGAAGRRGGAAFVVGRRPVLFDHVCTAECVPFHEHPGLGCRGLQAEIRRRRRGRG
jgi:hypothetical protein